MRFIRIGLRPALALFLIAHGLAHSVLPLRGWMDPEGITRDFMPVVLYSVSVLGFVMAGVGMFGVAPFKSLTRPALVVASAYSLVALFVIGQRELWWGAVVDVALLLIGLTGAYHRLPDIRPTTGWRHAARLTAGLAMVGYAATAVVLWPVHRTWGSLPAEHEMALPGDRVDRNPALELQHAVTVNAPPEQVWRWIVQLGQDRAGFYSYDWLERAFGVRIQNVPEIRPEWQTRQAGDRVRATQDGYLGGLLGNDLGWTVTDVLPDRAMVLQYWGAFVLEPTADGKTRFIIRTKVGDPHIPVWAAPLDMIAFELPHFIMERRMMLRIKSLAEAG